MGGLTCPLPPMPEYADLKASFEPKVYQSALSGWGHFFIGLGALEGIEDFYSCLAGNNKRFQSSLNMARDHFETSRELIKKALQLCLKFRASLPESARVSLSPNIKLYSEMTTLLEEACTTISSGGIPTLECIHGISKMIREDMVFGERMAQVNRGTHGHFPYPEDELISVKHR